MPHHINQEDPIQNFRQQEGQDVEQTLEQLLLRALLNPETTSTTTTKLMDSPGDGTISKTIEGTTISPAGTPEEIKQTNIYQLDDGTSTSGIVRCQTCSGIVKEANLQRCGCGRTVCVIPECGKTDSNNNWYCSDWHKFLGGFLGINLR